MDASQKNPDVTPPIDSYLLDRKTVSYKAETPILLFFRSLQLSCLWYAVWWGAEEGGKGCDKAS